MKYKAVTRKTLYGEIIVTANDEESAIIKARDVAEYDNYNWVNEYKIDIHAIHEVPLVCNKCGTKLPLGSKFCNMCGERCEYVEVDLGRVYIEYFDKQTQTTCLLSKLYDGFDTILLKGIFSICKYKTEDKNPFVSVSLYVKNNPINSNNIIQSYMTMTDIKNKYCYKRLPTVIDSDSYEYSILYSEIAKSFENNAYDVNGDYFFDKSIKFWAKADSFGNKGGRGSVFYIVGVNFKIQ